MTTATESEFTEIVEDILNGGEPVTHVMFKNLIKAQRFTKATVLPFMKRLWPKKTDKQHKEHFKILSNDPDKDIIIKNIEKTINNKLNEARCNNQLRETFKTLQDYKNEIAELNTELAKHKIMHENKMLVALKEQSEYLTKIKTLEEEKLILKAREEHLRELLREPFFRK